MSKTLEVVAFYDLIIDKIAFILLPEYRDICTLGMVWDIENNFEKKEF